MITDDQFVEIVAETINRHISRDNSVVAEDQEWENRNFARSLAHQLRVNGIAAPDIHDQVTEARAADKLGDALAPIFK